MKYEIEIPDDYVTSEVDDFLCVCSTAAQLYARKNHDYGNSFKEGLEKIGLSYGVGRLFDKTNRLVNLSKNNNPNYESIDDTILDLTCYSIMLYAAIKPNYQII